MAIKKTRRPKSKNYFTQETEDAIVLYNGTSDTDVKSRIYQNLKRKEKFWSDDIMSFIIFNLRVFYPWLSIK